MNVISKVCLYNSSKQWENKTFKNPLTTGSKTIKYFGVNITKDVADTTKKKNT